MVIGIVQFPAVKAGKEAEFLDWFAWINAQFALQPGFISRRLLRQISGHNQYAAIIEFDTAENFRQVGEQPFHAESAQRLAGLLEAMPVPILYNELACGR